VEEITLSPPRLLSADDDLESFDCGIAPLDLWLRQRALANHLSGASRSHVCASGSRVVGYYCLSAASIQHGAVSGNIRRNMPDPVPAILMGRLAVDRAVQGRGVGRGLIADAIERCEEVCNIAGVRVLLVHAKDNAAADFYRRHAFVASLLDPLTLMLKIP
jgi:GNAT superfamily N-acetyltransferase